LDATARVNSNSCDNKIACSIGQNLQFLSIFGECDSLVGLDRFVVVRYLAANRFGVGFP
jgi:hypothetical protein